MKKKEEDKTGIVHPKDSSEELKPKESDQLHKGYNEKNPAQPEGSFTPDSKTGKQ